MPRWPAPVLLAGTLLAGHQVPAAMLDPGTVLARQSWWDNRDFDWYRSQIPIFESPDAEIDRTYYYRWELLTKHLTYGAPETGYTFTEFIDRPFWSGAYGAISCPLGHQMYEARWLRDRRIVEDFARYWFETPGAQPRSYSNWYGDAVWATYLVTADSAFLRSVLPYMVQQYQGWMAEHWDPKHRMFQWDGLHDGMEVNINSKQTADTVDGAPGFRPTLNSYLFADARAIARAATLLGDPTLGREYAARAADLKARVQQELWDPRREFFLHQSARDEQGGIKALSRTYETGPYAGNPHGRELIGYVPWQFHLPDPGYERAWRFLMDTAYFAAPFGPTTAERHDPLFAVSKTCCVWLGNAWPYATTQTLVAMANLLNDYRQQVVTRADYFRLLRQYAVAQRKEGRPYIAEAADPDNGSWAGHDTYYHSEHYFHSGFVDLVITGLVGLRPRADDSLEVNPLVPEGWDWFALDRVSYRGRQVSIVWDRTGRRYGRGVGLSLLVDGRRVAQAPGIRRMVVSMGPAPALSPVDRPVNLAVNNGRVMFPLITASYSAPATPPHYLSDGNVWYHQSPPNRWTAAGSGNGTDWVELDFGMPRRVESVKLYFLDDARDVRPPAGYLLERWAGNRWMNIEEQRRLPATPEGHKANEVRFDPVETSRLRLVLTHQPGASSGLSEIEAWAHTPLPLVEPATPSGNLAFNPGGAAFPRLSASYTSAGDRLEQANDARIAYTRYSRNRWSARGTPNPSDWLQVEFAAPQRVNRVELHFVADGRGLAAPRTATVEYWDGGRWLAATVQRQLPAMPEGSALNTIWITPVETNRVRVRFEHAAPAVTAVTELLVWGEDQALKPEPFGTLPTGEAVERYTLRNRNGIEVRVMTYGGIITSLKTPDRNGTPGDIVLGYDSLAGYLRSSPYFGAIVGRYGNRIAKGRFTLDGTEYRLAVNNGPNHLHGGIRGFDKVVWAAESFRNDSASGVILRHTSPDGDEGYPGTLKAAVTYTLTDRNELAIDYEATTDKPTQVNLTQHSYFNLAGRGDILGHQLTLPADRYVPVDPTLIPTGVLAPVQGTAFDFRTPHAVGARIGADDEQLRRGGGYDHTFVVNRTGPGPALAATLTDPVSGRTLEIRTTEPGVQFYSGNFLDGSITGKGGTVYRYRTGLALEAHHFPDSPNQPQFPSTILRPGETYRSRTVWTFR